jgi:GAF domain-containing protein
MAADTAAITAESPREAAPSAKRIKRFAGVDGRSAPARRLRDIEAQLAEPLGGVASLTPVERGRVQAAAALSVRLEAVRSALAAGDCVASDEDLTRLANTLSRALAQLERLVAAKRRASNPASSLADYLASKAAEVAA